MGKLHDMCAFGDVHDDVPANETLCDLRTLRSAMRLILALALLGLAFSGAITYREYTVAAGEVVCAPLGPGGAVLGLPPCVYGLALYTMLVAIAAFTLRRTRGGLGDEIVALS